jgi:hypothetical protein
VGIVVSPQEAVEPDEVTRLNGERVPHERGVGLPLQVEAGRSIDLAGVHIVERHTARSPVELVQAAVAPVVVEELDGEAQPCRVALGHDDVQVWVPRKDPAVGEPAERLAHTEAQLVPADVLLARIAEHLGRRGVSQATDVHRDRHLQPGGGFPERLPLRQVVRTAVNTVGEQRRPKPHGGRAFELLDRRGDIPVRQMDPRSYPVQVGPPGVGEPVVDQSAVGDIDLRRGPTVEVFEPTDEDGSVHPVALEIGELLGWIETRLRLGEDVAHRGPRQGAGLILDRHTGPGTRRHGHRRVTSPQDVDTALVTAETGEILTIRLREFLH